MYNKDQILKIWDIDGYVNIPIFSEQEVSELKSEAMKLFIERDSNWKEHGLEGSKPYLNPHKESKLFNKIMKSIPDNKKSLIYQFMRNDKDLFFVIGNNDDDLNNNIIPSCDNLNNILDNIQRLWKSQHAFYSDIDCIPVKIWQMQTCTYYLLTPDLVYA